MDLISISNLCTACGWCGLVTDNAIDFSEVNAVTLRELAFDAERSITPENPQGDYRLVSQELSKVKIDPSKLTPKMLEDCSTCYIGAFSVTKVDLS